MTLRLFGAALILCGGLLTRRVLLDGERRVHRARRELSDAFEAMAEEIDALLTPLPALLRRDYGGGTEAFFAQAARGIECGRTLAESWRQAAGTLPLPTEERELVAALGARLGGTEQTVCPALRLAASTLRRADARYEQNRSEHERIITSTCVCISLLMAILLL